MDVRHITCRTLPVKRSDGHSAVAGAAYRAGEKLHDDRQERTINYQARTPDVWFSEILAPNDAPDWVLHREQLWNAAEKAERRKDGRPARDVTLGLPWGMTQAEHEEAARTYAQTEFVDKGHVVDLCFHRYGKKVSEHSDEGRATIHRWAEKGVPFLERDECADLHEPHVKIERNKEASVTGYKIFQPHAHAFVTPRALDGEEFSAKRNRQFDRAEQAKEWRYGWGNHLNERLETKDVDFRVSALAPEGDGALPLKPENMPLTSYHIEQQGQPSVVRPEREFNAAHNDAIRTAAAARDVRIQEEARDLETGNNSRMARMQAWWGNVRENFTDWRGYVSERAESFMSRFKREEKLEPQQEPPAISPLYSENHQANHDPAVNKPEQNEDEHER
ncbi:MAG: MobA/MobL family protein [Alphaproteobacteria bacterium]